MSDKIATTAFVKQKPFSDTVKALLLYTKQPDVVLGLDSVKTCLGPIYHPEMRVDDIITVLSNAVIELVGIKEFQTPPIEHVMLVVLKAPYRGPGNLGHVVFGVKEGEKFTLTEVYNSMCVQVLNVFRFTNVGWCREYLFPEEKGSN